MTDLGPVLSAVTAYGDALVAEQKTKDDALLYAARAELADAQHRISDLVDQANIHAQTITRLEAQIGELTHRTLIGCSQPDNVWGHEPEIVRIFIAGGKKPATINLDLVPQGATLVLSRKDRGDWFWALCDWIKSTRPDIALLPVLGIHEPENDGLAAGTYQSWVTEDATAARQRGLTGIQVLMGSTGKDGTWRDYYVADAADQLWFDVYHGGPGNIPKAYNPPDKWLAVYKDIGTEIGKPIGFAEFAGLPMAGDSPDRQPYLDWMSQQRDWLKAQLWLTGACWFNAPTAPARFTTQTRADAWLP